MEFEYSFVCQHQFPKYYIMREKSQLQESCCEVPHNKHIQVITEGMCLPNHIALDVVTIMMTC